MAATVVTQYEMMTLETCERKPGWANVIHCFPGGVEKMPATTIQALLSDGWQPIQNTRESDIIKTVFTRVYTPPVPPKK